MTRLLTAAVLIPAAWYLCKRAPFPLFVAAAVILGAIAAWECSTILRRRGSQPFTWLAIVGALGVGVAFALPSPFAVTVSILTGAVILAPILAMRWRGTPEAMLDAATATIFPVVFVGLPFAYTVALRAVPGENGSDLLLLAMLCVTLSDTFAYYVGSAFGAHPLAPVISPKKTWEGAVGGVAGGVLAALIAHFWFFRRLPLAHALVLGVLLSVAGILGDLAESAVKRAAGVKDSSALLPGHGGVLDRVDSLLVAAPVLYYYWGAFLSGS
jgi:phosphatidate cytidylyltransferase